MTTVQLTTGFVSQTRRPPRLPQGETVWLQDGTGVQRQDKELEFRFVRGEESALADVYNEHGALIYTYCRRQLGPETGRDVTQEVNTS